jgi:hypothetical protein
VTPPPVAPGPPICVIGNVCIPGIPVIGQPGVGWAETPVIHPWADGYVEATYVCQYSVPCRAEI